MKEFKRRLAIFGTVLRGAVMQPQRSLHSICSRYLDTLSFRWRSWWQLAVINQVFNDWALKYVFAMNMTRFFHRFVSNLVGRWVMYSRIVSFQKHTSWHDDVETLCYCVMLLRHDFNFGIFATVSVFLSAYLVERPFEILPESRVEWHVILICAYDGWYDDMSVSATLEGFRFVANM